VAPGQYFAVVSVVVEGEPLGEDWKLFNITTAKCALQATQLKLVARLDAELLENLKDQVATLASEKFRTFWEPSRNGRDPERKKRQTKKTEIMNVTSEGGELNELSLCVGAGFSCLDCKDSLTRARASRSMRSSIL
jgi:hypothetical protein